LTVPGRALLELAVLGLSASAHAGAKPNAKNKLKNFRNLENLILHLLSALY
jgi:hypothetical protein